MQIGPILAIMAAMSFAMGQVIVRRGVSRTGESFSAVLVGLFAGTFLFAFVLFFTGDWHKIWSLSLHGWILLAAAGIIHFACGRLLSYYAIKVIGANKASIIGRTNVLYAVTFGIVFLNEPVTSYLVVGVLCIIFGVTLVGLAKEEKSHKLRGRGVIAELGAGLFMGTSPIFIKSAIGEIGSTLAATFISYLAASLVIATLLLGKGQRAQLAQLNRFSLIILILGGTFFATGQLLRYTALSYSPVSVINPLACTVVIFVLTFSFLINRNLEVFTWKVFVGIASIVFGATLLFH
ncbi:DMT family transporter [Chloroflexota bacterium]